MTEDRDTKMMRDIAAKVAEHFPDYVLIIRGKDDGIHWTYSNGCYAAGACDRLKSSILEFDKPPVRIEL
jgi:hypothetical protein